MEVMKGAVYAACVLSTKEAGEEGESPVTVSDAKQLLHCDSNRGQEGRGRAA